MAASGSIVSSLGGAAGSVGLGWGALASPSLGVLSNPAVVKLQYALTAYHDITLPRYGRDGVYGAETHNALKRWANLLRSPVRLLPSSADIDTSGPVTLSGTLLVGFTSAEINQIQAAWTAWKTGAPGARRTRDTPAEATGEPPVVDTTQLRRDCEAAGGTWNTATSTCTPAAAEEGMGTMTWVLLLALGAIAAYGVYWIATEA